MKLERQLEKEKNLTLRLQEKNESIRKEIEEINRVLPKLVKSIDALRMQHKDRLWDLYLERKLSKELTKKWRGLVNFKYYFFNALGLVNKESHQIITLDLSKL